LGQKSGPLRRTIYAEEQANNCFGTAGPACAAPAGKLVIPYENNPVARECSLKINIVTETEKSVRKVRKRQKLLQNSNILLCVLCFSVVNLTFYSPQRRGERREKDFCKRLTRPPDRGGLG